jgi:hypothetical protein
VAVINIAIKVAFIFSLLSLGWKLDHLHGSRANDMPSSMEVGSGKIKWVGSLCFKRLVHSRIGFDSHHTSQHAVAF